MTVSFNNVWGDSDDQVFIAKKIITQKEKFLKPLASGAKLGAYSLSETQSGSDASNMKTLARKDGENYLISGSKNWVTSGISSDLIIIFCVTERKENKNEISAFILEKDIEGFKVGKKEDKLGLRASDTCQIFFDNCKVPVENMIGSEGTGHITIMNGLDFERAMIAPICLGISQRALEISIEYAKIREQFGKPISSFQMIQSKIADMYTWVEAIKSMVYSVLSECDNIDKKLAGKGKIHINTSASVMFASTTSNKVLNEAVQIHGGMGYMWESEINRLYRSSKCCYI